MKSFCRSLFSLPACALALALLSMQPTRLLAQTQQAPAATPSSSTQSAPVQPSAPSAQTNATAPAQTSRPAPAPPSSSAGQAAPKPAAPGQTKPSQATPNTPAPNQPAAGQPAQNPDGTFTLKQNVNEVNLIFTVTDRRGRFINNLQQNDFALLDDQRAPAQVYSFAQQTNLPLRVGLLIDASTSIRSRFSFEQQAATEFLLEVLRPQTDKAFVMGFDISAYVTQPFTNNPDLLESGVNKLKPGGGTALYDAVYKACRDQLLQASSQTAVRKALIVVSDGDDNQSRAYVDDAIKMCQRAETIIYSISTNTSPSRDRGDDVLQKMAVATGGTAFYPHRIEDMANSFRAVQEELRSQYSLAYKPADFKADGSFRTIYLTAVRGGYVVHARKGYFAPR